jgi:hypothetical protein
MNVLAGRYEVVRELGSDGTRTSFLARDRTTSRDVVVTQVVLSHDLAAADELAREAEALRTIEHPSVPALVEYRPVELASEAMLVRAYAPGESLFARTRSDTELLAIVERVIDVLAEVAPTVHGALAAERIVVDGDRVALVGFGAASTTTSDLAALASLLEGRAGLRSVAEALRAPNASFRVVRTAISTTRESATSPSADEVSAMRESAELDAKRAAERERAERADRQAKQRERDEKRGGRVRVDDAESGTTITIGRGQSSWLLFLVGIPMLGVIFVLPFAMAMGMIALVVGLPILALFAAALGHATRPHRLLLTKRGDYVLHRGDPRKPVTIGRTSTLTAQLTTFSKQGAVFGLNGTNVFSAWHPMSSVDVDTLQGALRRYNIEVTNVRGG